jgi:hypothetical protein
MHNEWELTEEELEGIQSPHPTYTPNEFVFERQKATGFAAQKKLLGYLIQQALMDPYDALADRQIQELKKALGVE